MHMQQYLPVEFKVPRRWGGGASQGVSLNGIRGCYVQDFAVLVSIPFSYVNYSFVFFGGYGTHAEIGAALALGRPIIIHAPNQQVLDTPYPF
jgi:hypothetical protein